MWSSGKSSGFPINTFGVTFTGPKKEKKSEKLRQAKDIK